MEREEERGEHAGGWRGNGWHSSVSFLAGSLPRAEEDGSLEYCETTPRSLRAVLHRRLISPSRPTLRET